MTIAVVTVAWLAITKLPGLASERISSQFDQEPTIAPMTLAIPEYNVVAHSLHNRVRL